MKTLFTLAVVAFSLTLSNCNGTCPFTKKATCPVGCTKPCCAKKTADCKTCSH